MSFLIGFLIMSGLIFFSRFLFGCAKWVIGFWLLTFLLRHSPELGRYFWGALDFMITHLRN